MHNDQSVSCFIG